MSNLIAMNSLRWMSFFVSIRADFQGRGHWGQKRRVPEIQLGHIANSRTLTSEQNQLLADDAAANATTIANHTSRESGLDLLP